MLNRQQRRWIVCRIRNVCYYGSLGGIPSREWIMRGIANANVSSLVILSLFPSLCAFDGELKGEGKTKEGRREKKEKGEEIGFFDRLIKPF